MRPVLRVAAAALLALAGAGLAFAAARGRTLVLNADIAGTVHLREGKRAVIAGCRITAPPGKTAIQADAGVKGARVMFNQITAGSL